MVVISTLTTTMNDMKKKGSSTMTKQKLNSKLNGSIQLLAEAMHNVFSDAIDGTRATLKNDMADAFEGFGSKMDRRMDKLEERIDGVQKDLRDQIETTNLNVHAQLAQNRKDVSNDVRDMLGIK